MYRSSNLIDERNEFLIDSRQTFLINSLYDAVVDGDLATVGFLLQYKKIDPNYVLQEYDAAALHTATGIGSEELASQIVQLLLNYGADPNIETSDGTTPLIIACIFGRPNVAKLLLKYGGNPYTVDSDGMNATDYASKSGFHLFQEVLENYNFDWSILESSDVSSVVHVNDCNNKFVSVFNNDNPLEINSSQEIKPIFSDIGSDVNCVEFCDLNTAFRGFDSDNSRIRTFHNVVTNDVDCHNENNPVLNNVSVSNTSLNPQEAHFSSHSTKDSTDQVSDISYRTDRIKLELNIHDINHGPVTASTKKVYYNLIKKVIRGKRKGPFDLDELSNFPEILRNSLKNNHEEMFHKWSNLEVLLSTNFSNRNIVFRGGKEKQFFTYLLLDPFITNNLSSRKKDISANETWKTFILSIFYVGKGKNSRPFSHLYEALKNNVKQNVNKKVRRIQNIWDNSAGVICLHVFHNVICAEAHTREAAMIDAIGLCNLTNIQSGEYYGIVKNWSMKQKQQLGVVLLSKALQIFLAEGERQIFPTDLK